MNLIEITEQLNKDVQPLKFSTPVTHVYNPLAYAGEPYKVYLQRFG